MDFAANEWHGDMPWDISGRRAARFGCGLGLNQVHFLGGSESQGVQVPQQTVSRAPHLPATTRPPRELDVAEHSARALVTHPTSRGAAVTPQAAGRAGKTHPRSEGGRTPSGPIGGRDGGCRWPARNGRRGPARTSGVPSPATTPCHLPDTHPAAIMSKQATPTTQRRRPQRPHPRPRRRLYAAGTEQSNRHGPACTSGAPPPATMPRHPA